MEYQQKKAEEEMQKQQFEMEKKQQEMQDAFNKAKQATKSDGRVHKPCELVWCLFLQILAPNFHQLIPREDVPG